MEDSFESVNKSVDLDNPSEHSVDLDDPRKQCSKGLSDGLPSDSSLGRLMDTSQDENDYQLAVPKVENFGRDDMVDIHVERSQNSLVNVREVNKESRLGGEIFEKQEVDEEDSISDQQSSGEEYGDEKQQRTSDGGGEGRRCSARLKGKTRKRWTNEVRVRQDYGLPSEPPGSQQQVVDNRLWSLEEKRQLLGGLRKHGSRRIAQVAEEVPTKSLEQVAKKLMRDKRAASYVTETHWMGVDGTRTVIDSGEKISRGRPKLETLDLPDCTPQGELVEVEQLRQRTIPTERWLEAVETASLTSRQGVGENEVALDCSEALPNVLTWIAEMEEHPDPVDCGGVDYAAIYRYLAALCQGEAPPDLDPATSARASRILPSLTAAIQGLGEKEEAYLDNYRGRHTKYRYEDSFNFNSKAVREVEALSKIPGLNPLGFHPELLADRLLPKLFTITQPFSDGDKKEDVLQEDEEEEEEMEEEGEDNEEDDVGNIDEGTVLGRESEEDMADDEEEQDVGEKEEVLGRGGE